MNDPYCISQYVIVAVKYSKRATRSIKSPLLIYVVKFLQCIIHILNFYISKIFSHMIPYCRPPTALASFPGSGNTWLRFLIESATGVFTGSRYKDLQIQMYGKSKNIVIFKRKCKRYSPKLINFLVLNLHCLDLDLNDQKTTCFF